MTPERQARIEQVAACRQTDLTVFMERVHKAHNVAAILRTCDAVGVMEAHAVPPTGGIPPLNHTAQGAQRWVRLHRHHDAAAGLRKLRDSGHQIYAAHFSDQAMDFRQPDYTRPTTIVLGTEKFGVSEEALAECDGEVIIPMIGMTQSLNVSVATALILYEAQRQRAAAGMYHPQPIDREPRKSLVEFWLEREWARRKQPPPSS